MEGLSIDLLSYHDKLKIVEQDGDRLIFDPIRKTYLKILPEELVRQCWIQYLMTVHGVSQGAISIEKQIQRGTNAKRSDMLVYLQGKPMVLFEFKSFNVRINENACHQVAVYNMQLKVPYIVISNGNQHYVYHIDFERNEVKAIDELPKMTRSD